MPRFNAVSRKCLSSSSSVRPFSNRRTRMLYDSSCARKDKLLPLFGSSPSSRKTERDRFRLMDIVAQ